MIFPLGSSRRLFKLALTLALMGGLVCVLLTQSSLASENKKDEQQQNANNSAGNSQSTSTKKPDAERETDDDDDDDADEAIDDNFAEYDEDVPSSSSSSSSSSSTTTKTSASTSKPKRKNHSSRPKSTTAKPHKEGEDVDKEGSSNEEGESRAGPMFRGMKQGGGFRGPRPPAGGGRFKGRHPGGGGGQMPPPSGNDGAASFPPSQSAQFGGHRGIGNVGGVINGGGGSLDEGNIITPGGGYQGCGKAPLNRFTPRGGPGGYIINGERQQYGEFPQYIHLETRLPNNMVGLCGGTLVSDQHVITAAHCVKDHDTLISSSAFTVIFGEDNMRGRDAHELRVGVRHICVSSKYRHNTLRYDWAVLTLSRPVQFNDYIQPACLPANNQLIHTHGPQSKCFLVGAGAIGMNPSSRNPGQAESVSSSVVNKLHTENVPCMIWGFGAIDEDRVCYTRANNMNGDSCVGDSGGPILCLDQQKRWTLMASVSYGSTFCEHSRVAVYARTRRLLPEMQQQCGIKLL